jgi:periplasmic protein TonB
MKKMAFSILFFLTLFKGYSQDSLNEKPMIYTLVDKQAEFEGGISHMFNFIKQNIQIPKSCRNDSHFLSCKVFIKFIVNETGIISNVEVIKGCKDCPDYDKETIRVIEIMPKWKPALVKNLPVKAYYTLPISYNVQ